MNVAKVLLSYYENMNQIDSLLSDYSTKKTTSPEKKADVDVRIKLLKYVQSQKKELDKIDNNKIIDSILKTGKKLKSRRTIKKSRKHVKKSRRHVKKSRRNRL